LGSRGEEVFALGEDRPSVARVLLSLDPDVARVFSLQERKEILDVLEKAYPEYLSPSRIARMTGLDNKTVSNALNYLVHSSGMIEYEHHGYRLGQVLMRPVEGRFQKVRYGLVLVLFFALAAGLIALSGISSPLLALAYLGLCFGGLYGFSKRRRNMLFGVLVSLMVVGEAGYVMWNVEASRESRIMLDVANETRAALLRASGTAGALREAGASIEPRDLAALGTRLESELLQAAALLSVLGSRRGKAFTLMEEVADDLARLGASSLTSFILQMEGNVSVENMLTHVAEILGRSVKKGRTWLGSCSVFVDVEMARAARADSSRLLDQVTSRA